MNTAEKTLNTKNTLDKYFQRYSTGEISEDEFKTLILGLIYQNMEFQKMENNLKLAIVDATHKIEKNIIKNEDSAYEATIKSLTLMDESLHQQIIKSKMEIMSLGHTNGRKIDNIKASKNLK